MHRDIELNRIDDMIIVIEPNCKISVGSHPYWTQRKIFWIMWETKQFWGTVDFHSISFSYYGSQWCPKTAWLQNFLQNIFLCVRQNKDEHRFGTTGWVNDDRIFNFWVNYPFNFKINFAWPIRMEGPVFTQLIPSFCPSVAAFSRAVVHSPNPNAAHHAEHNKKITFSFTIHFSFYINKKIY